MAGALGWVKAAAVSKGTGLTMRSSGLMAITVVATLTACSHEDGAYSGYVEGEYLRLAGPIAGRLDALSVREGDTVAAGAPLFALEADKERAAVDQSHQQLMQAQARLADLQKGKRPQEIDAIRAQYAQAQATAQQTIDDRRRTEALFREGVATAQKRDDAVSQDNAAQARVRELQAQLNVAELPARSDQVNAAEAEVHAAEAVLAQAQWQLDQKTLKAPAAGVIQQVYYRQGEWVPASSPIVSLLPPQNRKLRFYLPEKVAGAVHAGTAVQVQCDGCGAPITATVRYISTQAEYSPPVIYSRERREELVFLAEAWPADADALRLRVGQPVDVRLLAAPAPAKP
jgi:HlyD family secretion protein